MRKAIVTGANGFVGSAVVKELLQNDYKVWALDLDGHSDQLPVSSEVHVIPSELSRMDQLTSLISERGFDLFYHFAWVGSAGPARADTSVQLHNAQWTVDALRAAKALDCKRFLAAGSIMEHETIAACYTQGNRPGLGYIYGSGKVVAHTMCCSIAADLGIELVWPEITNAYGVGERSPRLVNNAIRQCLRNEAPQFTAGTQNYDFVYIDDVAHAFRLIGENGKPFHEYIIGSSEAKPLREFLLEMNRAIAPDLAFQFGSVPFTGVDMPLSTFDCSATERDTGFRAQISFAQGCKRTYDWWKSMEEDR